MVNIVPDLMDLSGTIVLPGSFTYVKPDEFSHISDLRHVVGESVEVVLSNGFSHNPNLVSVDFPNCVIIDEDAFIDCAKLNDFTFGDKLQYVGKRAFGDCGFDKIVTAKGVCEFDTEAFSHCRHLEDVIFNCDMTSIDTRSFLGCSSLKDVKFMGNLDEINIYGLDYMKVPHIVLPSSIKRVNVGLQMKLGCLDIEIPNNAVFDYDSVINLYKLDKWFDKMCEDNNDRVVVNTNKGPILMYDKNDPRYTEFLRYSCDSDRFIHLVNESDD